MKGEQTNLTVTLKAFKDEQLETIQLKMGKKI